MAHATDTPAQVNAGGRIRKKRVPKKPKRTLSDALVNVPKAKAGAK